MTDTSSGSADPSAGKSLQKVRNAAISNAIVKPCLSRHMRMQSTIRDGYPQAADRNNG